jgi:hypothetical protein
LILDDAGLTGKPEIRQPHLRRNAELRLAAFEPTRWSQVEAMLGGDF